MNKQEIIQSLNQFVDQIVEEHKKDLAQRYVRSKKVQFIKTVIAFEPAYSYIYGKTATGNTVKIYDRMCDRHPQRIECSCKDYDKRMKFKGKNGRPCKHIFALIDRYQTKRTHITNNLKGE